MKNIRTSGMTLIECCVAVAVLMVGILVLATVVSNGNHEMSVQRVMSAQQRLLENLPAIVGMPAAIRASIQDQVNLPMSNCIYGTGNSNCGRTFQGVRIHYPIVLQSATTLTTSGAITGAPNYPIRYNYQGQICDPWAGVSCPLDLWPLAVSTEFASICPVQVETGSYFGAVYPQGLQYGPLALNVCGQPDYIEIKLTIGSSGVASPAANISLPTVVQLLLVNVSDVTNPI